MTDGRIDTAAVTALSLWAAFGSLALVVSARAFAGAFDEPVGAAVPLLVTAISLSGSLGAWSLFHRDGRRGDAGRRLLDSLLAVAVAAFTGFACSATAAPATLAGVTCLLIGGLAFLVAHEGARGSRVEAGSARLSNAAPEAAEWARPEAAADDIAPRELTRALQSPPTQQVTRRRRSNGCEEIEATLLASFAAGERRITLHVPIHPQLIGRLSADCEPLEDDAVTIQVTSLRTYGVRLEITRTGDVGQSAEIGIVLLVSAAAAVENAA